MQKVDIQQFAAQLNALAETYEKRPVTPKALEVWFDVLKEFPTERVLGCLIGWPKLKGKFPAPAEVWRECNEIGIKEREEKAAFERKQNAGPIERYCTPEGLRIIQGIRKMFAESPARKDWPDYWREMYFNPQSSYLQKNFAADALKNLGIKIQEREPGEDDEPLGIPEDALEAELRRAA